MLNSDLYTFESAQQWFFFLERERYAHAQGSSHDKFIMFRMAQRITIILQGKCTSRLI